MKKISGIAASAGIAIGKALRLDHEDLSIPSMPIAAEAVPQEIARFEEALAETRSQVLKVQHQITEELGREHAEIFEAHLMLIEDRTLIEEVISKIKESKVCVEYVFSMALKKYVSALSKVDDEYLRERVADITDVGRRILRNLMGGHTNRLDLISEEVILIAYDLSPSDTAMMHKKNVIGFATDIGGRTSHTAIMAKSLEVPAVVGLERVTQAIQTGDEVIVDGIDGVVIVNPDQETKEEYLRERDVFREIGKDLLSISDEPAVTSDGHKIELHANMEMPEEVDSIRMYGAAGVGLYRTEYLYLNRKALPTEEEQFHSYQLVARRMKPMPVTLRTLDLGGDKFLSQIDMPKEMNPFLGWRAIRFCLAMPNIFMAQLRAILRSSVFGKVRVMYPLISGLEELREANKMLEQAKKDLLRQKIPFDRKIEVGAMIEIPSAAMTCDLLAREVDFFSIGTNDLIQYSLAADRVNEKIAYLYDPAHPAVLRLIQKIISEGHKAGLKVGMCGEMAADPELTMILVGLGLDEISVSPMLVPEIKALIRSIDYKKAKSISKKVMDLSTGDEIMHFAREEYKKITKGKTFYEMLRERKF